MAQKARTSGTQEPSPASVTPPSTTSHGKREALSILVPPSPTSSYTTGGLGSPLESYTRGTDAGSDTWTTPSTTPIALFHPKSDLPELSTSPPAPTRMPAQATTNTNGNAEMGSVPSDVLAIEQLQASMKIALQGLASAFEHIDKSTRLMTQLATELQERDQVTRLRDDMENQMRRQKEELEDLKSTLESTIQQTAAETIRTQLNDMIEKSVSGVIEERVRQELTIQIPDQLRQRGLDHQRQILEVQTDLHNSEARRYNASLQSVSLSVPLRPLLRPVPTPEQSPYPIIVTPAAMDSSTESTIASFTLTKPHPPVPAPMKMKRSTSHKAPSAISRSTSLQSTSSASELFPRDLKSLFSLDPTSTKTLLREYGLPSNSPSPQVDQGATCSPAHNLHHTQSHTYQPQPVGTVDEEKVDDEMKNHMDDMNTFMSHIGVPFLMVPPPKGKETNAERRRKLTPLIINKSGIR